ncbi:MAG: metallophosphoesterase [Candidatus Nanohaloarchaea archaeon]
MKLGIVSDTHDNLELAEAAIEFFVSRGVDSVVHCGDMVAPFTAELFKREEFRFVAVRGNNDGEWKLKSTVEEFGEFYNNVAELDIEGEKLAVYHGTEEEIADALVESGEYDYVLRGHTHEKKLRESGDTVEINPGGIELPGEDEEFHVATLELPEGKIEFHEVE